MLFFFASPKGLIERLVSSVIIKHLVKKKEIDSIVLCFFFNQDSMFKVFGGYTVVLFGSVKTISFLIIFL